LGYGARRQWEWIDGPNESGGSWCRRSKPPQLARSSGDGPTPTQ